MTPYKIARVSSNRTAKKSFPNSTDAAKTAGGSTPMCGLGNSSLGLSCVSDGTHF